MSTSDLHPKLVISPARKAHKLLFTKMRDSSTSSEDFVKYSKRAMRLLAEDALAEFPGTDVTITTPCGYVFFVVLLLYIWSELVQIGLHFLSSKTKLNRVFQPYGTPQ